MEIHEFVCALRFPPSFQDGEIYYGKLPATLWLADFQLSLRDEPIREADLRMDGARQYAQRQRRRARRLS